METVSTRRLNMWNKLKPYVISIAIALAVGGLAAFLTRDNMDIYGRINTPPLSPPAALFPVVWTILYILMGISAAIVYVNRDENLQAAEDGLKIYAVQLLANFGWSIIFFNFEAYWLAFIWLVLLWWLILKMIAEFRQINEVAAYLQIPYLIWVTFAGYLNFMIALLN